MQDFFDIPNNQGNDVLERKELLNDSNSTELPIDGFFALPDTQTQKQENPATAPVSLPVPFVSDSKESYVRLKRSSFEQMTQKIAELSNQLTETRQQNERFADFLMRVTYTLRDVPQKQVELKALLDFISKFLTYKNGKFHLEVMSLMFSLNSLPKAEFSAIINAINFHAWNGFDTEGVLTACRDYGIDFPDIVPIVNLVKSYIPAEILEKLNNNTKTHG